MSVPRTSAHLSEAGGGRLQYLDSMRAAAMLMVVLGHSGISFMQYPLPVLLWPIQDSARSLLIDFLLGWIRICCIPLFMVLAGFLAGRQMRAHGPGIFLRTRSTRLLPPLLLGSLILLPLTFFAWSLGWLISGQCTLQDIRRLDFQPEIQKELFGFAHLWFLAYLYLYCLIYALISGLAGEGPARILGRARKLPALIELLLLALLAAVLLEWKPGILFFFHNSFLPAPWPFLYYGCFFAFGILLQARPESLEGWARRRWNYLGASQAAYACLWILFPGYQRFGAHDLTSWGSAAGFGLFAALSIPAWFGFFSRLPQAQASWMLTLANASYWVYLVHLPFVGLLQVGCSLLNLPAMVKFLIVGSLSIAASLGTYQLWVRGSVLGRNLRGTRRNPLLAKDRRSANPSDALSADTSSLAD